MTNSCIYIHYLHSAEAYKGLHLLCRTNVFHQTALFLRLKREGKNERASPLNTVNAD